MHIFNFILALLVLIFASYVQAITFEKCDSRKQIINIKSLRIFPDPIQLNEKNFNLTIDMQVIEDIPSLSRVHMKVWKIQRGLFGSDWYLPAPCVLSIGCQVEHCGFIRHFHVEQLSCPVKVQNLKTNIFVEIPELGVFAKWFASGNFWIEMKLIGPKKEQLSCYSFKGQAKGRNHH